MSKGFVVNQIVRNAKEEKILAWNAQMVIIWIVINVNNAIRHVKDVMDHQKLIA